MSHSSALRGEDGARLLGDRTALGSQLPNTSTEVLSLEIGLMGTCVCLALIFFSLFWKRLHQDLPSENLPFPDSSMIQLGINVNFVPTTVLPLSDWLRAVM